MLEYINVCRYSEVSFYIFNTIHNELRDAPHYARRATFTVKIRNKRFTVKYYRKAVNNKWILISII